MSMKEQLAEFDLQLEVMPQKNRKMLYASIVVGLFMFTYYVFGLNLQEEYTQKDQTLRTLEEKLAENTVSLYKKKIANAEKKLLVLATHMEEESFKARSLQVKLEKMDYLSSDAKGLADMLERILKHSVTLGVNIDRITLDSTEKPYTGKIAQSGTIRIDGLSDFKSVLKLLRFIESQEALLEIKNVSFNIESKESKPSFVILITGYRITL